MYLHRSDLQKKKKKIDSVHEIHVHVVSWHCRYMKKCPLN